MTTGNVISFMDILDKALALCSGLPPSCTAASDVATSKNKLTAFSNRCGITGIAGRGTSSLINTLTGFRCIPENGRQTTVPVIIGYGQSTRCTIRYTGKLSGTAMQGSCEAVCDYLAEQCVSSMADKQIQDAIVTCDSPLLYGGIELADVPGFSPQANNSATLDFLTTCDCLLYILSGSQRPSDREIAFIMEAAQAVPALFFIIGKTDLLTVDDMQKADTEYSALFTSLLQKDTSVPIFHVSSKMGQELSGVPENNPAWQVSGIGALKTDIIETLAYEKYCKVARDVHDDLHAAVTTLHGQLNDLLDGHGAPVMRIRTECAYLKQRGMHISARQEQLKQRIEMCYTTIVSELDAYIGKELIPLREACIKELKACMADIPYNRSTLPATVAGAVAPRCARLILDVYDRIILDVHRHFRDMYEHIAKEISALTNEISRTIPGAGIDLNSIVPAYPPFPDTSKYLDDGSSALYSVVLPHPGLFADNAKKRKRATTCFSAILDGCINRNMVTLPVHIKEAVRKACDSLFANSSKAHEELIHITEKLAQERFQQLESVEISVKPRVDAVKKRISGFEAIAAAL